jgi:hypothetical protein
MTKEDEIKGGRQHQFDQVKAQKEIVEELKDLNSSLKRLIEVIAERLPPAKENT